MVLDHHNSAGHHLPDLVVGGGISEAGDDRHHADYRTHDDDSRTAPGDRRSGGSARWTGEYAMT